jgi:hypothetical protein
MTVGGIDLGKRQFTIAAIPVGEKRPTPAVVTVQTKIKDPIAAAQMLAARLTFYLEETAMFGGLRYVWLEEPWGKQTAQVRDLSIVLGFLAAQFHAETSLKTVSPDEWRGALGLPKRKHQAELKMAAMQYARASTSAPYLSMDRPDVTSTTMIGPDELDDRVWYDDHEADAVCMALGCRFELESLARETASR